MIESPVSAVFMGRVVWIIGGWPGRELLSLLTPEGRPTRSTLAVVGVETIAVIDN